VGPCGNLGTDYLRPSKRTGTVAVHTLRGASGGSHERLAGPNFFLGRVVNHGSDFSIS